MSGSLVESVGFKAMIVGMGVICFLYAPLLFWLKEIYISVGISTKMFNRTYIAFLIKSPRRVVIGRQTDVAKC